jgi:hypothetical protein
MTVSIFFCGRQDSLFHLPDWLPPPPLQKSVSPPWNQGGGGHHSLAGNGVGRAKWDDWRESLTLCLYSVIQYHTFKFNVGTHAGTQKISPYGIGNKTIHTVRVHVVLKKQITLIKLLYAFDL